MILDCLDVIGSQFEEGTGWALKPQGACRGDVCVPLPPNAVGDDGVVVVPVVAERLGMPLVDSGAGLWALGPAGLTGHALATAEAPDLRLPDLAGAEVALSSYLGQKVVLAAWASW